jgi:hypothetical protein
VQAVQRQLMLHICSNSVAGQETRNSDINAMPDMSKKLYIDIPTRLWQ